MKELLRFEKGKKKVRLERLFEDRYFFNEVIRRHLGLIDVIIEN